VIYIYIYIHIHVYVISKRTSTSSSFPFVSIFGRHIKKIHSARIRCSYTVSIIHDDNSILYNHHTCKCEMDHTYIYIIHHPSSDVPQSHRATGHYVETIELDSDRDNGRQKSPCVLAPSLQFNRMHHVIGPSYRE
jgi:hypothetical protein